MKKVLIASFIVLGLLMNLNIFANPSILTIQINGYNSDNQKNFVDIIVPDVNYPFKEQIKILEGGIISTSILTSSTKEVIFSYDGKNISIIISPGDNIKLKFKIDDLISNENKIHADIDGLNKEANLLIFRFNHLIEEWISKSNNAFVADKSLGELKYQSLREQEMNSQLKEFHDLVTVNKIDNKFFIDWAESKIKYAAGKDFCIFPFLGKFNKAICETDEYFNFIKRFNPGNEFVTSLQSHTDYLNTLISSFNIIGNISEKYTPERSRLDKDSMSYFPIAFKMIANSMGGKQREIALINIFLHSKDIPPFYIDSLSNYLSIDRLKKLETRDDIYNSSILYLLNEFDLEEEEKAILFNLYKSAEGKIIFHDFWFLRCSPCMDELPHYNNLIEKAGNEIEFIFYGVYVDEKKWKDAVKNYQLKGKCHLLTKNQIAFFERYFNLKGFPHHQLINKKGLIINENLPRVSPDNYEWILGIFEKIRENND